MLKNKRKRVDEFGDVLFTIVNIARWYKLDPEDSLNMATRKFISRYKKVESKVKSLKKQTKDLSYSELDRLWKLAKKSERKRK